MRKKEQIALKVIATVIAGVLLFVGGLLAAGLAARGQNRRENAAENSIPAAKAPASSLSLYQAYVQSGAIEALCLESGLLRTQRIAPETLEFTKDRYALQDVNGDGIPELFYLLSGYGDRTAEVQGEETVLEGFPVMAIGFCTLENGSLRNLHTYIPGTVFLDTGGIQEPAAPDDMGFAVYEEGSENAVVLYTSWGGRDSIDKTELRFLPTDLGAFTDPASFRAGARLVQYHAEAVPNMDEWKVPVQSSWSGDWKLPFSHTDKEWESVMTSPDAVKILGSGKLFVQGADGLPRDAFLALQEVPEPQTKDASVPAEEEEKSFWICTYWSFLRRLPTTQSLIGTQEHCNYALYDINKDGIPELMIKTGTAEYDAGITIYSTQPYAAAFSVDELPFSHSSLYTYPEGNGIVRYFAHMGSSGGTIIRFEPGEFGIRGTIYTEEINRPFVAEDGNYIPVDEVLPGSEYIPLVNSSSSLPLECYDKVTAISNGSYVFPEIATAWPEDDPEFYEKLLSEDRGAICKEANYYNGYMPTDSGWMRLSDYLRNPNQSSYATPMKLKDHHYADVNLDGIMDCILDLQPEDGSPYGKVVILSEKNHVPYAFYLGDSYQFASVDRNGTLLLRPNYSSYLEEQQPDAFRMFIDRNQGCILRVPVSVYEGN